MTEEDKCCVCLEILVEGGDCEKAEIPCGHPLCKDCLVKILETDGAERNCPLCGIHISAPKSEHQVFILMLVPLLFGIGLCAYIIPFGDTRSHIYEFNESGDVFTQKLQEYNTLGGFQDDRKCKALMAHSLDIVNYDAMWIIIDNAPSACWEEELHHPYYNLAFLNGWVFSEYIQITAKYASYEDAKKVARLAMRKKYNSTPTGGFVPFYEVDGCILEYVKIAAVVSEYQKHSASKWRE